MTRLPKGILPALIVILLLAGLVSLSGNGPGARPLRVVPEVIEIGAFYAGAEVRIEGVAEAGAKVVIVIRGEDTGETFNKKGRVGPIWVNTGKVRIAGVPSVRLVLSSEPVNTLLSQAVIEEHELSNDALKRRMRIEPATEDLEVIKDNFIDMKVNEGLYRTLSEGLSMGAPSAGCVPYTALIQWPKIAPPASYEIRVYQCRDGKVIGQSSALLEVVKVGFPARLSSLARDRAPLYGALSVIIALLAGFGIDFLASKLGKKGPAAH